MDKFGICEGEIEDTIVYRNEVKRHPKHRSNIDETVADLSKILTLGTDPLQTAALDTRRFIYLFFIFRKFSLSFLF